MKRQAFLLLAAAVAGAFAVSLFRFGESEARASLPPAPEWSYFCFDAQSAGEVNEKANQAAARGWELFAGSPGSRGAVWCLRRPGPAPLRDKAGQ